MAIKRTQDPHEKPATIRVRAAPGRVVAFPTGTIAGPGATSLRLAGDNVEGGDVATGDIEVKYDAFVRRRIRAGDLIEVGATRASASDHPNLSAARPSPLTTTSPIPPRGKE